MADADSDELERLRARLAELEAELARVRAREETALADLHRMRAQVEAIFEKVPANFYVKDLDSRYVLGSHYGFQLFGLDAKDVIGKTDAELFPPEIARRFLASDRRVLEGEPLEEVSFAVPVAGGPRHFAGVRFAIAGADGKPIGICGFAVDITERIELAQRLEKLAITDALTGLSNRRRFDEHLALELARAARSGEPLSLVLCDVDHFKRYNDRYGHPSGDACLASVARVFDGFVRRPADLAARYGGEEFALILPSTSDDGATLIAQRLLSDVRELAIAHEENDGRACVTVSAGVATVIGAWSSEEVLTLADRALYAAKQQGRDRHLVTRVDRPPASVGRAPR